MFNLMTLIHHQLIFLSIVNYFSTLIYLNYFPTIYNYIQISHLAIFITILIQIKLSNYH